MANTKREPNETPQNYYFRMLAIDIKFGLQDSAVARHIINGINDNELKRKISNEYGSCAALLRDIDCYYRYNAVNSSSPYASPVILVKKQNGENQLCVDYRALNSITIKDHYPLPRSDDQLDKLAGNSIFSSLDMASGFHQIPIAADSVEKTAFITPYGQFEYLRMPFGLANGPAVFQRAINAALGELKDTIALVYLDDVLIPTKTVKQGLKNLDLVLATPTKNGFSLNLQKCKFLQISIEYLGKEISAEGIRPGKRKIHRCISAITNTNFG